MYTAGEKGARESRGLDRTANGAGKLEERAIQSDGRIGSEMAGARYGDPGCSTPAGEPAGGGMASVPQEGLGKPLVNIPGGF